MATIEDQRARVAKLTKELAEQSEELAVMQLVEDSKKSPPNIHFYNKIICDEFILKTYPDGDVPMRVLQRVAVQLGLYEVRVCPNLDSDFDINYLLLELGAPIKAL